MQRKDILRHWQRAGHSEFRRKLFGRAGLHVTEAEQWLAPWLPYAL